jgi:hypothetical protein
MGIGESSYGIKLLGREADHLPSSGVEVKNAWTYTETQTEYLP